MDIPAPDLPHVLLLEGASNVRDLGGYRSADGRRVIFGRVFRAASLARLTLADQRHVAALGLRTICDFRGRRERAHAPSALRGLPGVTVHSLPIEPRVGASLADIVATGQATGEDVLALLRRAYLAYVNDHTASYRGMFQLLLRPDFTPLLFHCSAGKDRTGFAAALILTALGVGWEDVLADYLATNRLWHAESEMARGLPPELAAPLMRVHAELLEAAFAEIEGRYGSTEHYFEAMLGLDQASRERLRMRLLA